MKIELHTRLPCTADEAVRQVKKTKLLLHIAAPLIRFAPHRPAILPEHWQPGTYLLDMKLFGILPLGRQAVVISYPQTDGCFTLLDDGHSALVKTWRHRITVTPQQEGCLYRDSVEIDAGILTPAVDLFAERFYRHRQKRWRQLAETRFADLDG
ncbi:hypothetical protein [Neisseria sp.]|uniref:hypothetical protein n=1 Tax=Neisseria sp. TaxID=192066 RepID=UPI0035A0E141